MSKWTTDSEELERRDAKARIVHEYGPDDVDYLAYRRKINPRLNGDNQ